MSRASTLLASMNQKNVDEASGSDTFTLKYSSIEGLTIESEDKKIYLSLNIDLKAIAELESRSAQKAKGTFTIR